MPNLEIGGLSSHKYPYDGYLSLRLEFSETLECQVVDTLALVCQAKQGIAILVGTNTNVVGKVFESCREQAGDRFLSTLTIHPVIKKAIESIKHMGVSQDGVDRQSGVVVVEVTVVLVMVVEVIVVVTVALVMVVSEEMVVGKVVACGSMADSVDLLCDVMAGR